jgi:predicted permease
VIYEVSTDYFKAAGTRLLAGRDIDERDHAGMPPAAVVNETFVRKILGGGNALGKRFRLGRTTKGQAIEIVGVVEDGKYESLSEEPQPAVFRAAAQQYNSMVTLVARSPLPPDQALREIRGVVASMDPALPLFNVGSVEDELGVALFPARVAAIVLGAFGLLAAVLASTGVFAVVAYAVSRRTREIGIRIALGARRGEVLKVILVRTVTLLAVGVALGVAAAFAAGPLFSAVLYGVGPRDPAAFGIAVLLMAAVTAAACWYPSWRALRIQPAIALREE